MTTEEAIVEFEKQLYSAVVVLDSGFGTHPGENDRIYRKRKEMAEIALSALRAQQETEKNEPLTLDELREMDGETVWDNSLMEWCVIMMGCLNGWGVVKYFDGRLNRLSEKRFYRRKPKEGTK